MAFEDGRFKTDSTFSMILSNQILRHNAMCMGNVVAKDLPPNLTIADLQEAIKNNDLRILEKLRYFGDMQRTSKVQGNFLTPDGKIGE